MADKTQDSTLPAESKESVASSEVPEQSAEEYIETVVKRARQASGQLATLSTSVKNRALSAMADALEERSEAILAANEQDLDAFGAAPERKAMADRLRLSPSRISEMADGIREVAKLADPLGETPRCGFDPTGCRSDECGFPSASSASFTNPVRTSPQIPQRSV